MKRVYRGHELNVWRDIEWGRPSGKSCLIRYTAIRQSDGGCIENAFDVTAESVSGVMAWLKGRIDARLDKGTVFIPGPMPMPAQEVEP